MKDEATQDACNEKINETDKKKKQDSADGFSGNLASEEIRMICDTIRRRLKGGVSDANYEALQRLLQKL